MIKTIIFDLAEVYLNGIIGVERYLEPILGIKDYSKAREALDGREFREFMHGKISEEEYWLCIIQKNRWNLKVGDLKKLIRKNFNEIPGTRSIIESLKKNRYKLGLLSVHGKEWIEYCERKYDYHRLFDEVSYSYETGVSKPNRKAYQTILKKLNSRPEESLFIDDSKTNTDAAKAVGLEIIIFENPEQLRMELKNFRVKV